MTPRISRTCITRIVDFPTALGDLLQCIAASRDLYASRVACTYVKERGERERE
jgi:hypothetical protein